MTANIGFNPQNQSTNPLESQSVPSRTQALERLSSEIQTQQAPQPRDSAEISSEAARRQSEVGNVGSTISAASYALGEIQNSLNLIEEQVLAARDLSLQVSESRQRTISEENAEETLERDAIETENVVREAEARTVENRAAELRAEEDNAERNSAVANVNVQNEMDMRLRTINEIASEITRTAKELNVFPSRTQSRVELNVTTGDLGRLQISSAETVSLADFASDRSQATQSSPTLSQEIFAQAMRDISAAHSTVENYQSGLIEPATTNIVAVEELFSAERYDEIMSRIRDNFSSLNPSAIYEAAAAGISGDRAVELLTN